MHLSDQASSIACMAKAGADGGHANGKSRKRKRKGASIEPVNETATEAGNTKFARALASSDYSTRDKGLQVLTLWLKRRPNIVDADLSKIWKGLFYAFWHADKAHVQVRRLIVLCGGACACSCGTMAAAAADSHVGYVGSTCPAPGGDTAAAQ
jgi:Nucleolar protein,Nop52